MSAKRRVGETSSIHAQHSGNHSIYNLSPSHLQNSKRQSLKRLFSAGGSSGNNVGGGTSGSSGTNNTTNGIDTQLGTSPGLVLNPSVISRIPTTELELVQFIVMHGILRKELR